MAKTRLKMRLQLKEQEVRESWNYRNVSEKDVRSLAVLMLEAYTGTIDYEGESLDDSILEVQETIEGKYGPFLEECSFVAEENDQVVSASIVVRSEETDLPFLAFSITHPEFKNKGLATFLLRKSINALLAIGHKELYLVVTKGNVAAQRLYSKLGFCSFE